jgi:GNAT superfamily N-acetyltransferase
MTVPHFVIEEVRDLDAAWPELEALIRESHEFYLPIVGFGPPPNWVEEMQRRLEPSKEALILIARTAGRAVGFANAMIRTGGNASRHLYVDNVYVRETARGNGAGSALLTHLEAWAREREIAELRLDVFTANAAAVRFWGNAGFAPRAHSMSKQLTEAGG